MKKASFQKSRLTQAVLASTLFVTSIAQATDIAAPTLGPILTSTATANTFHILTAGSVTGDLTPDTDAVVFDIINSSLIIDANNTKGAQAILTPAGGAPNTVAAVHILPGFTGGTIDVGAGSGITNLNTDGLSTAIRAEDNVEITNAGAIVNSGVGSFATIYLQGIGSQVVNTGSIVSTDAGSALDLNGSKILVDNQLGGVIQGNTASSAAIFYEAGFTGLTLNNAGTIEQVKVNNTLSLVSPFTTITNEANGLITQTAGGAFSVIAVLGGGAGTIENQENGTILATTAGTKGISISALPFTGDIINAGTIKTNTDAAIFINQAVKSITNEATGSIVTTTPANAAIFANGAFVVSEGITNEGIISGLGGNAIDLGTNSAAATFNQVDGNVFGNVLLAAKDSDNGVGVQEVFVMDGGVISGNVIAKTSPGDTNLLALNGGTISGNVNLGDGDIGIPIGDTLNLNGTTVVGTINGGALDDTINVTDGSFGALDGKGGTKNTLNILDTFTADGTINNMNQINVKNAGTIFTLNNNVTNMNAALVPGLTINAGTEMVLNANISGSGDVLNKGLLTVQGAPVIDLSSGVPGGIVENFGTVALGSQTLTITSNVNGAFRNQVAGIVQVNTNGIATPGGLTSNGELVVNSTVPVAILLDADSFIQPVISGFIPQGTEFEVMSVVGGGTITNPLASGLIQPSSAVIFFTQELNGTNDVLSLVANRRSFEFLSSTQVTRGIAGALDVLALGDGPTNPTLLNLLIQLEGLATQAEVEAAMESLIPPFNYGLVAGSHIGMNSAFESVIIRLEDLYARKRGRTVALSQDYTKLAQNGVSFGDTATVGSVWGKVLGANLNQRERGGVAGYRAKGAGLAIGADFDANNCTTFGLAASYTKVNVDDKNASPKDQDIKSWQGTAYGWWEFMDGLYLDAMLGVSTNQYKLNRVINVNQIHTAAQSSFHGTQWGAQADLGWSLANSGCYYFAPFARLKYIHLDLNDYSEYGAGDLSLDVHNDNVKEFMGGLGFRLGYTYQAGDVLYVPEMSVMLGYDFKNDGEQTLAGFFGGGPAFATDGIKPGRTIFDLGLMLNAHVTNCSILTAKYNLELRSEFVSNAVYLQYNFLWS